MNAHAGKDRRKYRCIECGLAYGEPAVLAALAGASKADRPTGPIAACSARRNARWRTTAKRQAEGTLPLAPPGNPFER